MDPDDLLASITIREFSYSRRKGTRDQDIRLLFDFQKAKQQC